MLVEPERTQYDLKFRLFGFAVRVHPLRTARMKAMPDFWERPSGRLGLFRGLGLHVPRSRFGPVASVTAPVGPATIGMATP